jgi:hypothetical protein
VQLGIRIHVPSNVRPGWASGPWDTYREPRQRTQPNQLAVGRREEGQPYAPCPVPVEYESLYSVSVEVVNDSPMTAVFRDG